ncbi:PREDICTED: cyclin-A2-2-like [Lupinus angustifolius]|uniref:cyclin-A2-2-like n=1 Tax=Lupinus angustifolius TaxID=3871 RepID=UPI00092FA7C7|nr:PREDICTED: cyclin-A2-2-like [Lupinus angustifolius]
MQMNKENKVSAKDEERPLRITRSRTKALGSVGGGIPPYPKPSFKNEPKNKVRANSKRAASDGNKTSAIAPAGLQHKRRAVLTDVTNICGKSYDNTSKFQARGVYKKNTKLASGISTGNSSSQDDVKAKLTEELSSKGVVESHENIAEVTFDDKEPAECCMSNSIREGAIGDNTLSMQGSVKSDELMSSPNKEIDMICEKIAASDCLAIVDIDSELKLKDPLVWSSYAPDIYNKTRVAEVERKPLSDYMEKLQKDISPSMRAILIDWLVEVTEEYKLVPDTLYLTVNLIDRYLSTSLIQKQRLQLLGVTCMLIASKYEEICAPRVEEFCFITDNTYTREEVLKMEIEVLNLLNFKLSVPTTKTFLRRFIQAAQSSYQVPRVELEFLANYLAELTLVEYRFLKFLPSLVAASAVFLAKWTLNHSENPWNPTLEHYTNYKVSELKPVVLSLESLQLNTKDCPLNSIREKYKQQKFNCVANLTPKPLQSLFEVQA